MSVKKKAALVISWQKSFSIMAPWRKGKGDSKNTLLDSEVVLTKMKLFSNFHESLLRADDAVSTISTVSVIDQENSHSELNSQLNEKPQIKSGSKYLSAILSDSHLSNLYKCESEDSGVELPSGANSPSTPTGSEQSFVVHSRESSCDSSNLNSEPTVLSDRLVADTKNTEKNQANDSADNSLNTTVDTQDSLFIHSNTLISSAITVELHIGEDVDQCRVLGAEQSEDAEESSAVTGRTSSEDTRLGEQSLIQSCDDMTSKVFEPEPIKRSITSDSLEEYMDECCRLSKEQQVSSSPLSSGLGYLEHICQLVEKISQMQETNLQLQRQLCSLQKECRMRKAKEDFFKDYCSCGAASLAFQDFQKTQSRDEFSSPSGTLSDLSAIPEVTQHPLMSTSGGVTGDALTLVPPWRKSLNQRSYTEGEVHGDSTEGLSITQHTLSENNTWARVKDMVRKTKLRNHSRLGTASASLKMSCPQLYRPDLEPVQSSGTSRNSMIALGHRSTLDFPWLE
ncbi:uncharacterized protein si:ch211-250c4.3 isoform X2 [Oreochromis niloticus]|uniref:uncharacterized protein si:ch211-250c4.3 n=1 Tax=Oreochromis aureus TaxID=47969 RepID=UPI0003941338|nr:uncharacterized protein LOC102076076 isoform X2 [Oreochromis niloticus]XP_031596872.1 uncharacterized protein si:ch211-250c4.3 [Oreochromis aureus]CAI5682083.1 unnamed protein product [Mustela putorius furo]